MSFDLCDCIFGDLPCFMFCFGRESGIVAFAEYCLEVLFIILFVLNRLQFFDERVEVVLFLESRRVFEGDFMLVFRRMFDK